jgi:DNA-nicking Smr family endonuclease
MTQRRERRSVTSDENRLWRTAMKEVKPIGGKPKPDELSDDQAQTLDPKDKRPELESADFSLSARDRAKPNSPGSKPMPPLADFDLRRGKRLAAGKLPIDARIDLHGRTQSEARALLRAFLITAQSRGHHFVKVITGKGGARDNDEAPFDLYGRPRRGVLRELVPAWLAEPDLRTFVVSYMTAGRGHGGSGALYVQIRSSKGRGPATR